MTAQTCKIAMLVAVDLGARNAPAVHVLNIANELGAKGCQITLVVPRYEGETTLPVNAEKVRLVITPNLKRSWLPLPRSLLTLFQIAALWRLERDQSLIIRASPLSAPLVFLARRMRFKALIVEYNGWFADELASMGVPRFISQLFAHLQSLEARAADGVRTVTDKLSEKLTKASVPAEKITVIGNGVNERVFHPVNKFEARERIAIAAKARVMVFVGNLWPAVDMATIFSALALLRGQGMEITFLIAGDGRSSNHFKAEAARIGIEENVRFLGGQPQGELKYIIGASDIAVITLNKERNAEIGVSPLKLYEYAACGKPVIATDLPGLSEIAGSGWLQLAPAGDGEAWAKAIKQFYESDQPEDAERAARQMASEATWERRAEAVLKMIKRLEAQSD